MDPAGELPFCGEQGACEGRRAARPGVRLPETENPQPVNRMRVGGVKCCGATGNRTPDLLLAKQALYQLSYGPEPVPQEVRIWWRCKACM